MAIQSDEIPTIAPNNKPKKDDNLLTKDQLKFIQAVLEKSCTGQVCISRSKLYADIKDHLNLKIEKYQFEQALSNAINTRKIVGFEIKRGAYGGICKRGAFDVKPIKTRKRLCTITLPNKKVIKFRAIEKDVIKVITNIFKATPTSNGNLFINNHSFQVPLTVNTDMILEFMVSNIKW